MNIQRNFRNFVFLNNKIINNCQSLISLMLIRNKKIKIRHYNSNNFIFLLKLT